MRGCVSLGMFAPGAQQLSVLYTVRLPAAQPVALSDPSAAVLYLGRRTNRVLTRLRPKNYLLSLGRETAFTASNRSPPLPESGELLLIVSLLVPRRMTCSSLRRVLP